MADERFNVHCIACNQVWSPAVRTRMWWKAKKHAEKGYLDALHVVGTECGCVQPQAEPEAPYRVIGFDDMCVEFDIPFTSFVEAVREYMKASRELCTVFIKGVSPAVEEQLMLL